jgi:phytoene synthase
MGDPAGGLTLETSYDHCRRMARGSSFYPAFFLVDQERRRALWAVYAFNRRCDDLSDERGATLEALEDWRRQLEQALRGGAPEDPIWPAFADAARRFEIPERCFHAMIDGVSSDLAQSSRETYADLYRYCYQVASVVGISVAAIFGARGPAAEALAERCGVAVQLTNIIRDVREDFERGRVYLAQEDLRAFGVNAVADSPQMRALLRDYAARAERLFAEGAPLAGMAEPGSRACLKGILGVYAALLHKLGRREFAVFGERVRLSRLEKLGVLARAYF